MADLGITAVELMPVAQFPGTRNWGYDGTYPYAVQNSYGGPEGLKTFVNECHRRGLAVILDVVYNHIGPEGNYTGRYGPYFTNTYKTPWGAALNFDGPYSDQVRRFFIDNALFWITEYHIDALRLDAVHAIFDSSAYPFLRQLADAFHTQSAELGRNTCLIAESVDNDARLTSQQIPGGLGMDCQWNDDFHHSLHVMLTGESQGYYQDFGGLQQLSKAYEKGFVYDGQYSKYRKRQHGVSSGAIPGYRLVVFSQNHDQVGNRAGAERLASLVPFEALKLAAAACILSPFLPLIFMGEEFAATSPFYYFVSHSDPGLIQAVRKGRREEFASFDWRVNPPDPNDPGTFECSRLIRDSSNDVRAEALRSYYKELIKLRFEVPALARLEKTGIATCCSQDGRLLTIWRTAPGNRVLILLNFGQHQKNIEVESGGSKWKKLLDSSDSEWGGGGQTMPEYVQENEKHMIIQPYNFCIYSEVQLG